MRDAAMFKAAEDCFLYMTQTTGKQRKMWEFHMYKFLFYWVGYEE